MYMKADEFAATACYLKNENIVIKMNNPYSDPNDDNDETNFTGIRRRRRQTTLEEKKEQ